MKSNKETVSKAILAQTEIVSHVLKSLSHPTRLKILCRILDVERSVNDLTDFCEISQSAMSQFLNRMKAEGIVSARRDRNFVFYSIADKNILKLLQAIKVIYC